MGWITYGELGNDTYTLNTVFLEIFCNFQNLISADRYVLSAPMVNSPFYEMKII